MSSPLAIFFFDLLTSEVDAGPKPLVGSNNEQAVTGLDGLGDRCKKYYELGAYSLCLIAVFFCFNFLLSTLLVSSFSSFSPMFLLIFLLIGARFGKWRAPYAIDIVNGKPSELVIKEQAWGLARYAAICQVCRLALFLAFFSFEFVSIYLFSFIEFSVIFVSCSVR